MPRVWERLSDNTWLCLVCPPVYRTPTVGEYGLSYEWYARLELPPRHPISYEDAIVHENTELHNNSVRRWYEVVTRIRCHPALTLEKELEGPGDYRPEAHNPILPVSHAL